MRALQTIQHKIPEFTLLPVLIVFISTALFAQSKQKRTRVGIHTIVPATFSMKPNACNPKIIQPLRSAYGLSIERRLSIHTKLNFSFQYSLNYQRLNRVKAAETAALLKLRNGAIQDQVNLTTYFQLKRNTSVFSGVGLQNPGANLKAISSVLMNDKGKSFQLKDLSPALLIGLEQNLRFIHKDLFYSFQYQLNTQQTGNTLQLSEETLQNPPRLQGQFQLGLKYRY